MSTGSYITSPVKAISEIHVAISSCVETVKQEETAWRKESDLRRTETLGGTIKLHQQCVFGVRAETNYSYQIKALAYNDNRSLTWGSEKLKCRTQKWMHTSQHALNDRLCIHFISSIWEFGDTNKSNVLLLMPPKNAAKNGTCIWQTLALGSARGNICISLDVWTLACA